MRRGVLALTICLVVGLGCGRAGAQTQTPPAAPPAAELAEKQTILVGILRSIKQLEQELKDKQHELRSPQGEGRREELTQQIQQISARITALRENLDQVASGVDLTAFGKPARTEIDWRQRILDLLWPLLSELTRLTARPREIEELRAAIAVHQEQQRGIEKGLANVTELAAHTQEPTLVPYIRKLQQEWQERRQEVDTQLRIARQQLKQKLDEQPSLADSARTLMQLFFRSRGRNFVLAGLAFVAFWLCGYRLQKWLQTHGLRGRKRTFSLRLFNVAYTFFTIVGATFCFLLVLYLYKDWVLLTLALLFLLGIAWTSKHTLPRFLREMTLLLNIGAVREGERVIYNGLPWRVQALNFYALLVNPELEGGTLRLPLRDFHDLRSRPYDPDEPWFPTRTDDWVLLDNQMLAKVILQTPELVRLVLLGGSRRTFSVPDFLAQSPRVLSTGFRLDVTFSLDYQHQALITQTIPARLEAALREALQQAGHARHLVNLRVEFAAAGASSLDVQVLADFGGAAAPHYQTLRRLLQRICVDTCNAHGWVIPFTQITLHLAAPAANGALPMPANARPAGASAPVAEAVDSGPG